MMTVELIGTPDEIGIIVGTETILNIISKKRKSNNSIQDILDEGGVVNGDGSCEEYETGDIFWFCCDDDIVKGLLPF